MEKYFVIWKRHFTFDFRFNKDIKMRVKSKILPLINTRDTRFALAIALDVSEPTVRRYINENTDELTKAAALMVIRDVTKLTDNEILEPAKVEQAVTA